MGKILSDEQIIKDFKDNLNELDEFINFYRKNGRIYGVFKCKKNINNSSQKKINIKMVGDVLNVEKKR